MNGLAARATITRDLYKQLSRGYRLRLIEAVERCEREIPPPPHGYDTRMLVDPLERKRAWRLALLGFKKEIDMFSREDARVHASDHQRERRGRSAPLRVVPAAVAA